MIRHRDGGTRRGDAGGPPSSVPDLGRSLRRARTRQGLRMEDVSARTGLPLDQLAALEAGTVDRIPDRVAALKTLRRYADFLGLPGERFVVAVVDHWPTPSTAPPAVVAFQPVPGTVTGQQPLDTGAIPVAAPAVVAGSSPPAAGLPGRPAVRAGVPAIVASVPPGFHTSTAQVPMAPADTGVIPAVQPPGGAAAGRPRVHAPLALRILVPLVALAVLVGLAGLLVHRYEPHWLDDLGITHSPPPARQGTASSPATTTAAGASFAVTSTSANAASFAVGAPTFLVKVVAVGYPSWVRTTDGDGTPTFVGILAAGGSKTFTVQHSLSLEVGSVSAHVFVSVGNKTIGFYFPPAAPYTMTFKAVS